MHARLELLWRALSNSTLGLYRAFYAETRLAFFRYEFRRTGDCTPLRLVAALSADVAAVQVNSGPPNWVFAGRCRAELSALRAWHHRAAAKGPGAEAVLEGAAAEGAAARALPWIRHGTKS